MTDCKFEQETENIVRVSGSRFVPDPYTVKLEGARCIGYRTVSIAGARDPIMIEKIDEVLEGVRARVTTSGTPTSTTTCTSTSTAATG